jgi:hypothetical protein
MQSSVAPEKSVIVLIGTPSTWLDSLAERPWTFLLRRVMRAELMTMLVSHVENECILGIFFVA